MKFKFYWCSQRSLRDFLGRTLI